MKGFALPFLNAPLLILSARMPIPRYSMTISMAPVTIAMIILSAEYEPRFNAMIERQIFSVITQVKKGTRAVKRRIVLRAVHFVAKHESPEIKRKAGIRMLENP